MFYYDLSAAQTANATPGTVNQSARLLTVANQRTAAIMGLYVSGRNSSAGGIVLRLNTAATAGSAGSAYTLAKRDPDAPAASTTAFTAHTVGTTLTTRQVIGCAAQGGFGGWFAATPEQALVLKPNGGANGNAEVANLASLASAVFDLSMEVAEL